MTEQTWLTDAHGNRCSVEWFGSREAAQAALDSLKNCRDCANCSDCSDCSGCSRCSGCSDCSGCSRCSRCSGCSGCSDCSDCSGCSRCSRCSGCSGCSDCSMQFDQKNLKPMPVEVERVIVPVIPNIHQRVLEAVTRTPDALNMNAWHTCETTHCRAGWVVTLAGEAGKKLEAFHDTQLAAALIYHASSPDLPVAMPRFFEGNAVAMADMRRMAALEIAAAPQEPTP